MMTDESAVARLHYELIHGLLQRSACPTSGELASRLGWTVPDVEDTLRTLSDIHGVVLHPHVCAPWVVHPFSVTPTINWIAGETRGWWAPCVWCAFGVAVLAGGETRIHTRLGAEAESLVLTVRDGEPAGGEDVVVHFAIPPVRAWNNVHQHCSLVLPFASEADIDEWCRRHGHPRGEAVPLRQVARLARLWYGSHAQAGWHKWSVAEAQEIFEEAGLRSAFWDLGAAKGKF